LQLLEKTIPELVLEDNYRYMVGKENEKQKVKINFA